MKLTIIPSAGSVAVDGEHREVDLSEIDPDIHAVQWDGVKGHIETVRKGVPETFITDIEQFQLFIDRWNAVLPPPPPPPPPTDDERIDNALTNNPVIRALIRVIAEDTGRNEAAVVARMKALR